MNVQRHPNPRHQKLATMQNVANHAGRTNSGPYTDDSSFLQKKVPYGCNPFSFKEVHICSKFDTDYASSFRRATHVFQAEYVSEKDLYLIIIEGADLSMHQFTLSPPLPGYAVDTLINPSDCKLFAGSNSASGQRQICGGNMRWWRWRRLCCPCHRLRLETPLTVLRAPSGCAASLSHFRRWQRRLQHPRRRHHHLR